MIIHHGGCADTTLTPKQLAAHVVADYGVYFTDTWRRDDTIWSETRINMTEREIAETERFIGQYVARTLKLLNLKPLDGD